MLLHYFVKYLTTFFHMQWPMAQFIVPPFHEGQSVNYNHTLTVLWPFFRNHLGEPVPKKNFWIHGARED